MYAPTMVGGSVWEAEANRRTAHLGHDVSVNHLPLLPLPPLLHRHPQQHPVINYIVPRVSKGSAQV